MLLVLIAALGEVRTVTAEAAGSSPVVPAIHSTRVRRLLENRRDTTRKYTLSDACRRLRCFFRWQNHFHYFALRPPLLAADSVGIDVHGAVGVAHQRLHRLHILVVLSEKG